MGGPGVPARFALLADGTTVEIRQAGPGDAADVRRLHERLSPESSYLRFFSVSPHVAEGEAKRLSRPAGPGHVALLARLGGQLAGVASYEPAGRPGEAEVAFAVADELHGRGIATLLLEHLVSAARREHLTAFTAQTLPENLAMQRVFADAGLSVQRRTADGVVELTMPLPGPGGGLDSYLDAVAGRASRADVASLRPLLAPGAVAVVGAGRSRGSVGRELLENVVAAGYPGEVYPVNARGGTAAGRPCLTSPAQLPDGVDLAIVAVPGPDVAAVAEQCGARGVKVLLVVSAGLQVQAGRRLLAVCRRYGMRLAGPDSIGVAVPGRRLHATFAASAPQAGTAGVVVQSGGIGVALMAHLSRLGIGVSSFVSAGDKYDVSGNDMLTWWEQDGLTELAILYLESFGNPRGFARTARRVGRAMPVLTVVGGRSAAGQAAAARLAAGSTAPAVRQEALFAQAGVIATESLAELTGVAALLCSQPQPAGRRVAVVSNAGGAAVLAADACAEQGLSVAAHGDATQEALRALLPAGCSVAGPVDTTAAVAPDAYQACLEQVAADPGVDAVLAVAVPTAVAELTGAVTAAAVGKPLAAVLLDRPETVTILTLAGGPVPGRGRRVPAYADADSAARALARAAAYRAWRESGPGRVPDLDGVDTGAARALVAGWLAGAPDGRELEAGEVAQLLACYSVRVEPQAGPEMPAAAVCLVQDPVFGPVVVAGGGHVARLAPLTDADAAAMAAEVAASGGTGGGLAWLALRVSRLADDLPEVAEADLHPVPAGPGGPRAGAARIRLAPATPADPFVRQLR